MIRTREAGRATPPPLIRGDKIGFVPSRPDAGAAPALRPAITLRQVLAWSRFFVESARRSPFRRA